MIFNHDYDLCFFNIGHNSNQHAPFWKKPTNLFGSPASSMDWTHCNSLAGPYTYSRTMYRCPNLLHLHLLWTQPPPHWTAVPESPPQWKKTYRKYEITGAQRYLCPTHSRKRPHILQIITNSLCLYNLNTTPGRLSGARQIRTTESFDLKKKCSFGWVRLSQRLEAERLPTWEEREKYQQELTQFHFFFLKMEQPSSWEAGV